MRRFAFPIIIAMLAAFAYSCSIKEDRVVCRQVTGLTLSNHRLVLRQGGEPVRLVCSYTPENAKAPAIVWVSSDEDIVTVSPDGVVTPCNREGAATVIACLSFDPSISDRCEVSVSSAYVPVTHVAVSPDTLTLDMAQTARLSATVSPVGASNPEVSYHSDNSAVASVDASGVVTAVGAGITRIHAVCVADGVEAVCGVRVNAPAPGPEPEPAPGPRNLAENGPANCYLISEAGEYRFPLVIGNSDRKITDAVKAEVLWETVNTYNGTIQPGDIIKSAGLKDSYVHILTADPLRNGNALVAVKGEDGTILWSWHIWVCYPAPADQTLSSNGVVFMDRNLGALSASDTQIAESLGMLYQHGRKDPFPGCAVSGNNGRAYVTNYPKQIVTENTSETGNIAYATAHPVEYIPSYLAMFTIQSDWDRNGIKNKWNEIKTIYDPCPPGYIVPKDKTVWPATEAKRVTIHPSRCGVTFDDMPGSWFPAAGFLHDSGTHARCCGIGMYHTCVSMGHQNSPMRLLFDSNTEHPYLQAIASNNVYGQTVRCVKDTYIYVPPRVIAIKPDESELHMDYYDNSGVINWFVETSDEESVENRKTICRSSDESIISIERHTNYDRTIMEQDAQTEFRIKGLGHATVTATASDGSGVTGTCDIYVTGHVWPESVEIWYNGKKVSNTVMENLPLGATLDFEAVVKPDFAADRSAVWSKAAASWGICSWDGNIAHVTLSESFGKPFILYCQAEGEKEHNCTLTNVLLRTTETEQPYQKVTSIDILHDGKSTHSMTVPAGTTVRLIAVIGPDNATNKAVKWERNMQNTGTISPNGNICDVRLLSPGTLKVTATSLDKGGIYEECRFTIQ